MTKTSITSAPPALTFMVKNWPGKPDWLTSSGFATVKQREIHPGPIFDLEKLLQWLTVDKILPATDAVDEEMLKQGWGFEDIFDMVHALRNKGRYVASEWCFTANKYWLRADAYAMNDYDDGKEYPVDLYLKFGVSDNGKAFLTVSCHPQQP